MFYLALLQPGEARAGEGRGAVWGNVGLCKASQGCAVGPASQSVTTMPVPHLLVPRLQ